MGDLTNPAAEIGALFRRAHASHLETVQYLIECGKRLLEQKEAVGHGEWMLWLKAHQAELGFADDTAQRMMGAAKRYSALTRNLEPDEAAAINRQIWRNDEPKLLDSPPLGYLSRFAIWADKHPPDEFRGVADETLLADIQRARAWLDSLERLIPVNLREVA